MTRARSFELVWPYAAAAALGYLLGSLAVPAFAALAEGSSGTPLLRVALVLREDPHALPEAWPALAADVEAVRSTFASPEREVFELVLALRGVGNGGNSDWNRAEQICRSLNWPRCDRAALTRLQERRP